MRAKACLEGCSKSTVRVEIDLRDHSVRCVNNRAGLAVCLSMINIPRVCNQEKECKSKVGELGVIPVCACINVCMCIYAYVCVYIWGWYCPCIELLWRSKDNFSYWSSPFALLRTGSLIHCFVRHANWSTNFRGFFQLSLLSPCRVVLGLQGLVFADVSASFVGSRGPNSTHRACTTSTLPNEPSSQPVVVVSWVGHIPS